MRGTNLESSSFAFVGECGVIARDVPSLDTTNRGFRLKVLVMVGH